MGRRVLQAAMIATLCAACQSEGSAQRAASGDRPFTVAEVADFDTPWAMAFLPGSGVPLTNMALLTEKQGRVWLVDVASGKRTAVSTVAIPPEDSIRKKPPACPSRPRRICNSRR